MSKYKLYIIFLLVISICSFNFLNIKASNLPLVGKVIYLDAGHGGVDPGAVYKDVYEKDINLLICQKLQEKLEYEGATVYMTRYDDYDLSNNNAYYRKKSDLTNRYTIINESQADIYISIHLNSVTSSNWQGAQTFYTKDNKYSKILGTIIQKNLKKDTKTDRESKEFSGALMNDNITIPGVLVEAGFLSNYNDRNKLITDEYQSQLAESIKNAVIEYFDYY